MASRGQSSSAGQDKAWGCPDCDYKSNRSTDVRRHQRSAHTDPSIKAYNCPRCIYGCNQESHCKTHFRTQHSGEVARIYWCPLCSYHHGDKPARDRHIESKHGKPELDRNKEREADDRVFDPIQYPYFGSPDEIMKNLPPPVRLSPGRSRRQNIRRSSTPRGPGQVTEQQPLPPAPTPGQRTGQQSAPLAQVQQQPAAQELPQAIDPQILQMGSAGANIAPSSGTQMATPESQQQQLANSLLGGPVPPRQASQMFQGEDWNGFGEIIQRAMVYE